MDKLPPLVNLNQRKHYRIIPSVFPPINFFEELVDSDEMEALWYVESLTNDRLRVEAGDLLLVKKEDRICGPGSSVIMGAFTHIGNPTRFSDGSFGVYYAANMLETAVSETVFHREQFLRATAEPACEITMRVYVGKVLKPIFDLRTAEFEYLHDPDDYLPSQHYGKKLRDLEAWGVVYRSVRHSNGECIGVFRPPALSIPTPSQHLAYCWNGSKIEMVYQKTAPIFEYS